jgi:hypothetical protein
LPPDDRRSRVPAPAFRGDERTLADAKSSADQLGAAASIKLFCGVALQSPSPHRKNLVHEMFALTTRLRSNSNTSRFS